MKYDNKQELENIKNAIDVLINCMDYLDKKRIRGLSITLIIYIIKSLTKIADDIKPEGS